MQNNSNQGQVIYFSHGGGPLPILGDSSHQKMIQFMQTLPGKINKPEAIIVFSAHWEENIITIQSGAQPSMMYDYYGFPPAAYSIKYPCQGNSKLAAAVGELLQNAGINCILDDERPYDHGSYIPLKMMYPDADIPVIQISLNHSLNAAVHLKLGEALKPLLTENVLMIGSGFSFHNMRAFDFNGEEIEDARNNAFQDSLIEICCIETDESSRYELLADWDKLPHARYCHPREEHLLPLHVCAAAATGQAELIFDNYILGKRAIALLWR